MVGIHFFLKRLSKIRKLKKLRKMRKEAKRVRHQDAKRVMQGALRRIMSMQETNTLDSMPIDAFYDICCKFHPDFVWSLRGVCKGMQSLVESPSLANLHLLTFKEELCIMCWTEMLHPNNSWFYLVHDDGTAARIIEEPFVTLSMTSISSTDGLISYMGPDGLIRVRNPLTRELLILPPPNFFISKGFKFNPNTHIVDIGLGFGINSGDPFNKTYKSIAVLSDSATSEVLSVQIFTLGKNTGRWRDLDFPKVYPPRHLELPKNDWPQRVYAHGAVYWARHAYSYQRQTVTFQLVKFDFQSEKFKVVPLPRDSDFQVSEPWLVRQVDGCLCLYRGTKGVVFMWTLRRSGDWVYHLIGLPQKPFVFVYPLSTGLMMGDTPAAKYIFTYDVLSQVSVASELIRIPQVPAHMYTTQIHSQSIVSLKNFL